MLGWVQGAGALPGPAGCGFAAAAARHGIADDGCAGAPPGKPQYPDLLAAYGHYRPPWDVAGIDYPVGAPSGLELKDPAIQANLPPGATVDPANHLVRVVADNVTIDGFDFSLHGSWGIYIANGAWSGTIVRNSTFLVGANNTIPLAAAAGTGNLTAQSNTFDGGGTTHNGNANNAWTMISYAGSGAFAAQYNLFVNTPKDGIEFIVGTVRPIVRYNVFVNIGTGPGAHAQAYEYVGNVASDGVDQFNTVYQPVGGGAGTGNEGIQIAAQRGSRLSNLTVRNDTIIAPGPARTMSCSIAILQSGGTDNRIDGIDVRDNYLDFTGTYYAVYPLSAGGGTNLRFRNNKNLVTGTIVSTDGSGRALPAAE
jgi:hypothetical protein